MTDHSENSAPTDLLTLKHNIRLLYQFCGKNKDKYMGCRAAGRVNLKERKEEQSLKDHFWRSLKIAAAALASIFIAGELGLESSSTAGIITILSIQKTKRETVRSASNRILAYGCALLLAAVCFRGLGYTLPAFAVYLFLFAFLCMFAGWQEAITTDSVLISHFLQKENMGLPMLVNETLLLLIGAGMGILVNLHLHSKEADFARLAEEVDRQIKNILRQMARRLPGQPRGYLMQKELEEEGFRQLEESLRRAKLCAAANYNNSFFRKDTYQLDYIRMRSQQTVVLKGIYENMNKLEYLPRQTQAVAALFAEVEKAYHKENTVVELLERLHRVMDEMKQEKLPESREEFEARAILFYILLQTEELLGIKREFIVNKSEKSS